jgi:hypothetical protein
VVKILLSPVSFWLVPIIRLPMRIFPTCEGQVMGKIELRDAMNENPHAETHTFPIPETELRHLNQVEEKLKQQPVLLKARDFIRGNRWGMVAAIFVTGALLGLCLRQTIGRSSPG